MDDKLSKSKTDCVYFLASPLTCKKGSECEFRHSESARLNPRDCWYWLDGSCRNPHCAFRHPPLEGFTEQLPNTVHSAPHTVPDTSRPIVPCHFFFNSYCKKGDQCLFAHDMSQKLPKPAPESTNLPETKTSTGSDTGPASVEVPPNPSETTLQLAKQTPTTKEAQEPAQGSSAQEETSPSAESSAPECEETDIKLPDSPVPPEHEHPSQDQSSEELGKEEWWESSPGFDVLVDDGSEQLPYPDDPEYLLARERESEMLHSHLLHYDYEGPPGYDPGDYYPNAGYDSYDLFEGSGHIDRRTPEYYGRDSEPPRERFLEPVIHRKRKSDGRGGEDLRDHLRKRRRMDGSRKHRPTRARGTSRERSVRRGMGPPPRGRLASEVGENTIDSLHSESESFRNHHHRRDWSGYPPERRARSRHRERERRRRHVKPPELLQSSAPNEATSSQVMAAGFSGPKTLAQIREGSRGKASLPRGSKTVSKDFEGPKSLDELLKDKRSHASGSGQVSMPVRSSQAEKKVDSDFNDDDDDDDDDGLHKKLAHFLSQ